jgi:hypothetical protein
MLKIPELAKVPVSAAHGSAREHETAKPLQGGGASKIQISLAAYLKGKNAGSNQVRKFLATSVWLHDRGGKDRLTTKDVTSAISENHCCPAIN